MKPLVLTDLEGTTSSIAMVREVLFPYARSAMPDFVRSRGQDPQVRKWLDAAGREAGRTLSDEDLIVLLQNWIDADRKDTALKAIQGLIWESGYARGEIVAHVYPDAAATLRRWQEAGYDIYVYSSGSTTAQKRFLRHSIAGDLSLLISGYFDTEVGPKQAPASYAAIATRVGRSPAELLFLSDVVQELDAAREAGLATVLVDRRTDYPRPRVGVATRGHHRVESFDEIHLGSGPET